MNEYVNYEDLKEYRGIPDTETEDDAELRDACTVASRMFDGDAGRRFYPLSATRYYDHPVDPTRLELDEDLLEVTTFTTQNTSVSISSGDYFLKCGGSHNLQPYNLIEMKTDGDYPVLLYSGTLQQANAVTGLWGYHEDWAAAWVDANDTVQDAEGINTTVTTVTVTDVNGADIYGLTPRFKVQQLIKVDAEYMYVTAKSIQANTLTVRRGVNGTTAATHANAAAIYIYEPLEDIVHAVKLLATWVYEQRKNPLETFVHSPLLGTPNPRIPNTAPLTVHLTAKQYRYRDYN